MSLKNYRTPKQSIALPDGTAFNVRGLTFHDLGTLLEDHRDEFLAAGQIIAKQDAENMGSLASVLAQTVPDLAAAVIALASDEPDAVDVVRSLPLPVQLDALIAVGKLTFTDEGAVPKFLAGLGGMLRAGASAAKMAPSVMR